MNPAAKKGAPRIVQSKSTIVINLIVQSVQGIYTYRTAATVQRDNQSQAQGHLHRRNSRDKKDEQIPIHQMVAHSTLNIKGGVVTRKTHQGQIDRIEHQLEAYQHDHHMPLPEQPREAQGKKKPGEH